MIRLNNVSKYYNTRTQTVKALNDVNLEVKKGAFIVVQGPSGSGKTTLLLTLGGMLQPTRGTVIVDDKDIYALNATIRARFRAQKIGFVFQMFHLLPYLNGIENVLLAAGVASNPVGKLEAEKLLERMGLTDRMQHKPSQLSVGERQRNAIARALINKPEIILADEPTGNLDPENAALVMKYLAEFHHDGGTVIMATHSTVADPLADGIVHLLKGKLVEKENSILK